MPLSATAPGIGAAPLGLEAEGFENVWVAVSRTKRCLGVTDSGPCYICALEDPATETKHVTAKARRNYKYEQLPLAEILEACRNHPITPLGKIVQGIEFLDSGVVIPL